MIDNWRKSTRSADNSACVETGWNDAEVGYRDSKDAGGASLTFGKDAAHAFLRTLHGFTNHSGPSGR